MKGHSILRWNFFKKIFPNKDLNSLSRDNLKSIICSYFIDKYKKNVLEWTGHGMGLGWVQAGFGNFVPFFFPFCSGSFCTCFYQCFIPNGLYITPFKIILANSTYGGHNFE